MNVGYCSTVKEFLDCTPNAVVDVLSREFEGLGISPQYSKQIDDWSREVEILSSCLKEITVLDSHAANWTLILDYPVPRCRKPSDALLLTKNMIFVIEFEFGAAAYEAEANWQTENYALNLRDFHAESFGRVIVPVLCAADAPAVDDQTYHLGETLAAPLLKTNSANIGTILEASYRTLNEHGKEESLDAAAWLSSDYRPNPNIIEAASALYENHSVRNIAHSYTKNLSETTDMIEQAILSAQNEKRRILILITGVPGSGKTLTGLNIVHNPSIRSKQEPARVFLTKDSSLWELVKESLGLNSPKNKLERNHSRLTKTSRHFFYDHHSGGVPHNHVVVLDDAHRVWSNGHASYTENSSEPLKLLSTMERVPDWAVVIGLVGLGQELVSREAGLDEWVYALQETDCNWNLIASPEIICGVPSEINFTPEPLAHLAVSARSHRAPKITDWAKHLLRLNPAAALESFPNTREFPLFVTRSLSETRKWLKRGSRWDINKRIGLVCSSQDPRLNAYSLTYSAYSLEKWFLAPPEDIRSSLYLDSPASESLCLGLELDYVGVCWGGDLTLNAERDSWVFRNFRGSKWQHCHQEMAQNYILNRYRVLLTRARLGMIIWVPPGCKEDPTRNPEWFDGIYEHLRNSGVPELPEF